MITIIVLKFYNGDMILRVMIHRPVTAFEAQ